MGCTTRVTQQDYFDNHWKMCRGVYWGMSGGEYNDYAYIVMSRTGEGYSIIEQKLNLNEPKTFDEFTVNVFLAENSSARIEVWKTSELSEPEPDPYDYPDIPWDGYPDEPDEPIMTKAQILTYRTDKLGYSVGDTAKSECTIKNIGGDGTIYLLASIGYLDSSNMIYLTGFPVTDQLFLGYQQFYTFKEDIKIDITDYYRQQGIGWAYLQQQMYLFFLAGHKENGNIVWDTEKHIKMYIDEPEGFKDPTALDESILGDIKDVVDDAIPAFGGLGGLGWVYDKVKDVEHAPNWVADMLRDEPDEPEEQADIMPFLYIGFIGIISYMLIKSR